MKTAHRIIISLTLFCVSVYGEFVTKEEFEELKQIVGSLKRLYMNEKTQNDQLRRKCNDLEGTLKYVLDQLESTQSKLRKFEHETESLGFYAKAKTTKGTGQNSSIENNESKLASTNKNDQQNHQNRRTMIQKENYSVDRLFRRFNPVSSEKVVFSAWNVADRTNLGSHQTIVFPNVLINEGNFYHPTTGVFSPSISGVYAFYFSIIVSPNVDLFTALVKDGTEISHIYAFGGSNKHNQVGNMAIVHLNAGDSVWVRISSHPASGYDIGSIENSFSGFLLYSDNN